MKPILKAGAKLITKQLLILLILCVVLLSCKKEKSRICKLYDSKVSYAIGTIYSITSAPLKAAFQYSYFVDGKEYKGEEKAYGVGQGDESLIGKRFIVIYASGYPSDSDLNTDFLIETEQDFDDFKSEFSAGPPTPDFPNKCK